jgi:hypothetical protein
MKKCISQVGSRPLLFHDFSVAFSAKNTFNGKVRFLATFVGFTAYAG